MPIVIPISKHDNPEESTPAGVESCWGLAEELAKKFGTPMYLYDGRVIADRIGELRGALPPESNGSEIFYSFKANPNPAVAAEMRKGGCRADLTSPGEIEAARMAGFDLSQALYGGPGNSVSELVLAIDAGIRHFSVESERDLQSLSGAADSRDVEVRALLRINPHRAPKAKLAMSGVASQFGFEEDCLHERGKAIVESGSDRVSVVGIHIYWGTQIGDAESLIECFSLTVEIAEEISERLGFPLEVLNLGGGFPWPYAKRGAGDLDTTLLRTALEELRNSSATARNACWWFESGRYLSASSGTLITRVMDIKKSKGEKTFLILDTGIHHLGGMSGLGRIPRFSIDLEVPPTRMSAEEVTVDVVGQLCTPLDCIGKKITLPSVEPGDLLRIPNVGAYGPTASVLGFLSRPAPIEVLHQDGRVISTSRLRGGHEILFHGNDDANR